MQWWYKKLEETPEGYLYAYSHESKELDGRIEYVKETKKARIIKGARSDENIQWCLRRSLEHFYAQVVDEGFPDERHVACG